MNYLNDELARRCEYLEEIIKKTNKILASSPTGSLRITNNKGRTKYYIRSTPSDRSGTYVNKSAFPLAQGIAQRDYDNMLKQMAERELEAIRDLLATWEAGAPEDAINTLTPARRSLVKPRLMTDEEYVAQWLSRPYTPKGFKEGAPVYRSAGGQRVRSKSEALIMDVYDSYGIPVKYECPLRLKNGWVVHPDFTPLNVRRRKTFIHDHFGMADDPQYMDRNVARLNALIESGWIPGVNMILTFETKENPLDVDALRKLIEANLL